jgi:DNA-binding NtrC family response regulator
VLNLAADEEQPATLGYSFPGVDVPLPYKDAKQRLITQFESQYLQSLMHRHGGNVTQAAKAAGLSRKHLYELLAHAGEAAAGEGLVAEGATADATAAEGADSERD